MKKGVKFLVFAIFMLSLAFLSIASASLEIKKEVISDVFITELKNPAVFKITLKNTGDSDKFSIYSLVGVELEPKEEFTLASGEEKTVVVTATPGAEILKQHGAMRLVYKIKGEALGIQEDILSVNIADLESALEAGTYNIDYDSDNAKVYFRNNVNYNFKDVKARFKSAFFDFDKSFDLQGWEKKEFDVSLNKEEAKKLVAGTYIVAAEVEVNGVKKNIEGTFKFLEKSGIVTEESSSGIIVWKKTIEKRNEGNVPAVAEIKITKNAISRLLTNFNIDPSKVERKGFFVDYYFQKEIRPSESLVVRAATSFIFPLILIIAIIFSVYLASIYKNSYIVVRKKAAYVKTKGGEFALKISLNVRARSFVDKIQVIDQIPRMVKVHSDFGAARPDRIDEKNRRLEWNIDSLQAGEERVFSYIIFSKIGVVGKFEIPSATAVFDKDGKAHETESNRVYFLTEARKRVSEI